MANFPYMKWYPKDYLADTMHLTLEQDAIYRRLLDLAWMAGDGTLPNNDREIARLARISLRVWRRVKPDIVPFFQVVDGRLFHKRIAKDRESLAKVSAKQSANSKAKYLKNNETAPAMGLPNHSHSQNIYTNTRASRPESDGDIAYGADHDPVAMRIKEPPLEWMKFCADERPDLDPYATFIEFRDFWMANGAIMSNWTAKWVSWVRKQRKAGQDGKDPERSGPRHSRGEEAARAIARGLGLDSLEGQPGGEKESGESSAG